MKLRYRLAATEDREEVMKIAEAELNSGFGSEKYMDGIFAGLGRETLGIVALDGAKIAGFAFLERGMSLSGGRTDFFDEIRRDIGDEEIWTGAATAVLPEYQGFKVGAALYIYTLSALEDIGAKHLLLEIWVRPDGFQPSEPHLHIARDYTEYGLVPDFYKESADEGYICPVCGKDCKCSARIAVVHI